MGEYSDTRLRSVDAVLHFVELGACASGHGEGNELHLSEPRDYHNNLVAGARRAHNTYCHCRRSNGACRNVLYGTEKRINAKHHIKPRLLIYTTLSQKNSNLRIRYLINKTLNILIIPSGIFHIEEAQDSKQRAV